MWRQWERFNLHEISKDHFMPHEAPVTQSTFTDLLIKCIAGLMLILVAIAGFICETVLTTKESTVRMEANFGSLQSDVSEMKTNRVARVEFGLTLDPIDKELSDHESRIRKLERPDFRALTPKEFESGQH